MRKNKRKKKQKQKQSCLSKNVLKFRLSKQLVTITLVISEKNNLNESNKSDFFRAYLMEMSLKCTLSFQGCST